MNMWLISGLCSIIGIFVLLAIMVVWFVKIHNKDQQGSSDHGFIFKFLMIMSILSIAFISSYYVTEFILEAL